VDLERHRPIDLWPDRTADTLATWLRAHPGVTILSRDRSTEYAHGATLGAPEAQHVLDRRQLVRHLRSTAFPERAQSRRLSLLDAYVAYLQNRWDAGCHNGVQLWREIHALGFAGTCRMVSN
jgi:transposase